MKIKKIILLTVAIIPLLFILNDVPLYATVISETPL